MPINMAIVIYAITVVKSALDLLISNASTVSLEINKMMMNNIIIMDTNMKGNAMKITVHCQRITTTI